VGLLYLYDICLEHFKNTYVKYRNIRLTLFTSNAARCPTGSRLNMHDNSSSFLFRINTVILRKQLVQFAFFPWFHECLCVFLVSVIILLRMGKFLKRGEAPTSRDEHNQNKEYRKNRLMKVI
jgi:hypothetical protein